MTLMRFDPLREWDRLSDQVFDPTRAVRSMPMEAFRRGDEFFVVLDVPGVDPANVDVTVERNVVSVKVQRRPARAEGDEVIVDERPHGEFTRQLFLGDNLDATQLTAECEGGVLTLRIPVAEQSKPRRVSVAGRAGEGRAVEPERSS